MRYSILILTGLMLLAGCGSEQPFVTADRLQRGLVIVLPGIEGRSYLNEQICQGLNDGGVNWAIEIDDWGSAWGMLYNLRAEKENRKKALRIAERIARYKISYPDRPVVLVGQSGGGAMAVWAAESLQPGQNVRGLVLINASLSREYNLAKALEHCDGGVVNFYSPRDWFLLGLGTTVYGTMDREHTVSAGKEGFRLPEDDTVNRYSNLHQIGWSEKMAETGHIGTHLSSAEAKFVARYIAPLVLQEGWSAKFVKELQEHEVRETACSPVEAPLPAQAEPKKAAPAKPKVSQTRRPDKPAATATPRPSAPKKRPAPRATLEKYDPAMGRHDLPGQR